jgi:filamentous hemagglutinin family protein
MRLSESRGRIAHNGSWACGLGATAILLTAAQLSSAAGPHGIRTDGTLGAAAATLAGPNYNITQSLGALSGKNLFYSFQYFNVASGETALFTTTTAGIANIISRVTGGFASDIAGTLQVNAASGAPDFFFINPSGITFAPGAVVNVPASLYVATANYLKFPDGRFYSDTTHTSQLSAAAPEAFGFLGTTRAPVNVQTSLLPGVGGQFQAVAGDVTVDGQGSAAEVITIDGNIRVIATGTQTTEVPLSGQYSSSDGQVTVQNGGLLNAVGDATTAAGEIDVSAGTITVDGAHSANPTGVLSVAAAGGARQISLQAAGDILIQNGSEVLSQATDIAPGANVNVQGTNLIIRGGDPNYSTGIRLGNDGAGAGGTLSVTVAALSLDATGSVTGDHFTGIRSVASPSATGPSGQIVANVAGPISILNGAEVVSFADPASNAGAGAIDLTGQTATIAGSATAISQTGVGSSTGAADAGAMSVNISGDLRLANGGALFSFSPTSGAGANITVKAGTLTSSGWDPNFATGISAENFATGASGAVQVSAGKVLLDGTGAGANTPLTGIESARRSSATGAASSVTVTSSSDISVLNGADIKSIDEGSNIVQGGSVTVNATSLTVDNGTSTLGTGIVTKSVNGAAGNVTVNVNGTAQILDSGLITSGTQSAGRSGDVSLKVGSLLMDGGSSGGIAQVFSGSFGLTGPAGNVTVGSQGAIQLANASIASISSGSGNAGSVSVSGTSLAMKASGTSIAAAIDSDNFGTGQGGNLSVNIAGPISISVDPMSAGSFAGISTETQGSGGSGILTINAQSLSMDSGTGAAAKRNSASINSANLGPSNSIGRLAITTSGPITLTNGASISAGTASSGNSGDLSINAASLTLNGGEIATDAVASATGSGGILTVTTTGPITLSNGGLIDSSTAGGGSAGSVSVSTPGIVSIGGGAVPSEIASSSVFNSTGQSGNVSVSAGTLFIVDGGAINIADAGTRSAQNLSFPSKVQVNAGTIVLDNGFIFASSTGNVDAGSIDINYTNSFTAANSRVDTTAASSNGGPITVTGSGILSLHQSQITTSVLGTRSSGGGTSNGGDIQVYVPFILLDTAAIQANTNVQLAQGGNVDIQAKAIVPTYSSFVLGGTAQAFDVAQPGFNLIQAVNPEGVSGTLNVTTPTLDVGNSLLALRGAPAAAPNLGRSPCGHGARNTLSLGGRGGLPPTTRGPLWSALDPGAPADSQTDSAPTDLSHTVALFGQFLPCTDNSTTTTSRPSLPSL